MLQYVERMIHSHPRVDRTHSLSRELDSSYERLIQSVLECGEVCSQCADVCLDEPMVGELIRCIKLNLDCADVCQTVSRVLSRHVGARDPGVLKSLLDTCASVCRACRDECEEHGIVHEHCQVCAEICRECEESCHEYVLTLEAETAGLA